MDVIGDPEKDLELLAKLQELQQQETQMGEETAQGEEVCEGADLCSLERLLVGRA